MYVAFPGGQKDSTAEEDGKLKALLLAQNIIVC